MSHSHQFSIGRTAACAASLIFVAIAGNISPAEEVPGPKLVASLATTEVSGMMRSAIGVTRRGTVLHSLISPEDLDLETPKVRILLIGGMDGSATSTVAVLAALRWIAMDAAAVNARERFVLSAVPCLNPDGLADGKGPANGAGGNPGRGYPPSGGAYDSPTDPEAAYLWRWIGMHAPDLVVDVRAAAARSWYIPPGIPKLGPQNPGLTPKHPLDELDALAPQLLKVAPSQTGTVPAIQVRVSPEDPEAFLPQLLETLTHTGFSGPSPARRELQRRLARTPMEVGRQLSQHYGQQLQNIEYITSLAVVGRVRIGQILANPSYMQQAEQIATPYYNGTKTPPVNSPVALAGHLVFCELADAGDAQRRDRYVRLARAAADAAVDAQGRLNQALLSGTEMSDAVFMGGPILSRVGRLTGELKYFEACVEHLRVMQKLDRRSDGLYRHSPLDEAAWGRGNGFPALGLSMSLIDFPADYPKREELFSLFRTHMEALVPHQDPTGAWHQVIDKPESYREFTATAMITFAMMRGVRHGWLDREQYLPIIDRGWYALRTRIAPDGQLVDVCTGTGKQKDLRAYYDRPAILGTDARGGAMALMVCSEMARFYAAERRDKP